MTSHDNVEELDWTEANVVDLKTFGNIKCLRLHVSDENFSFKAGQWVDFNIPGVTPFTGYSMVSPPSLLASSNVLDLAIKYSDYPPTLWIHEKCKVGDVVHVRAGGNFFYSVPSSSHSRVPSEDSPELEVQKTEDNLLLLAGGVGINPVFSVLQHFLEMGGTGQVILLYSARAAGELIFKDKIVELAKKHNRFRPRFFSSRDSLPEDEKQHVQEGRIGEADVRDAFESLQKSMTQVFICGPPSFIDDMESFSHRSGAEKDKIHYEKWW